MDSVRAHIDGAFAELLGTPSLRAIAEMLGREPVFTDSSLFAEPEAGEPQQEQLSLF